MIRIARSLLLPSLALLLCLGTGGCKRAAPRNPEALRDAYVQALRSDDPKAAYALLSPEVQARTSYEEFQTRWKSNSAERKDALTAAKDLDPRLLAPVMRATTTHEGGKVLRWSGVGGGYVVVSGLPAIPDTSTAEGTIRALVAALRSVDAIALDAVLAPELLERLGEDWQDRADQIAEQLSIPGKVVYSEPDRERASLRYPPGHMLMLERTDRGWRVTDLR